MWVGFLWVFGVLWWWYRTSVTESGCVYYGGGSGVVGLSFKWYDRYKRDAHWEGIWL